MTSSLDACVLPRASTSPDDRRRDRVEKLREYARFGVRFHWLLDPEARTLELLELGVAGSYTHPTDTAEGSMEVPGCSGLMLDLDEPRAEVERLGADTSDS